MSKLVLWLVGVLLFAFAISIFLWFRTRRVSRFQARLALFFFLFGIIPATPLTLFLGQLLVKSSETFLAPGIEGALTTSLETFRRLLNEQGKLFLHLYPDVENLSSEIMDQSDVIYVGVLETQPSGLILTCFKSTVEHITYPEERFESLLPQDLRQRTINGELYTLGEEQYFESYVQMDSGYHFAGFTTPPYLDAAKNKVSSALQNYLTLGLLQTTMVEENVVWMILLIFILFVAVISVLLARLVASGISEPIKSLTHGMEIIGSGDLDYRIHVKAKDEVAFLVDSFNHMAKELKQSREELQRVERIAAWRDIARQISHEIKNPLTPIEFSIHRLESSLPDEWLNSTDLRESLDIIQQEIKTIRTIADTFSQFAKMPQLDLQKIDINPVIRSSVDLFRNETTGISIRLDECVIPEINVDEQQFRRVMHNLLKNAIEACQSGDQVSVSLKAADSESHTVQITVADTGCGMDDKTLSRMFEPYFTTKKDGSGIGMFLVQKIVSEHGGILKVDSEPGKGTTIIILL